MTSSKTLSRLRALALLYFLVAACATLLTPVGNGVKAPLLTLMGGASIVVVLFPLEFRRITSIGTALGTVIAMFGSGTWFADATQGQPASIIEFLFPITITLTSIFVTVSIIVSVRRAILSRPEVNTKPRRSKKALLVFGTLSIILFVLHVIRSSLERKRQNDSVGKILLE